MSEKSFGIKELNLMSASGTPTIESPNDIVFKSGGSNERVRITSGGNMGVGGLASPGALLSIPAGESNTPRLAIESAVDNNDFTITQYEDGNGTYTMLGQNVKLNSGGNNTVLDSAHRTAGILLDARNHGSVVFLTGGANAVGENVKIDSGGRLLVGTTSLIDGSTASNFQIASPSGPRLCIARNNTNVTGGNLMGALDFYGNDSDGNYEICGRMILEADGTHTTDAKPTRMAFYTTPSGSDTATERLRITSAGDVGIGGMSPNAFSNYTTLTMGGAGAVTGSGIDFERSDGNIYGRIFGDSNGLQIGALQSGDYIRFEVGSGTERARITTDGLTFNGDTSAANALDDYEEGTSTVSIQHITADTNEVYMTYTKIGSVVCIVGVITITNKTSSSSTNGWFHLPFAPSAHNTSKPGCSIQMNTINTSVAYLGFYGNNTNCYFNSLSGGYQNGNSLGNGKIGFTVTYTTH